MFWKEEDLSVDQAGPTAARFKQLCYAHFTHLNSNRGIWGAMVGYPSMSYLFFKCLKLDALRKQARGKRKEREGNIAARTTRNRQKRDRRDTTYAVQPKAAQVKRSLG
jgi:hypothetical protein